MTIESEIQFLKFYFLCYWGGGGGGSTGGVFMHKLGNLKYRNIAIDFNGRHCAVLSLR